MKKPTTPPQQRPDLEELEAKQGLQEGIIEDQIMEVERLRKEIRELRQIVPKILPHVPEGMEECRFTMDGQQYQIIYPAISLNGVKYTASELMENVPALRSLVAMNSGAVVLLTQKNNQ